MRLIYLNLINKKYFIFFIFICFTFIFITTIPVVNCVGHEVEFRALSILDVESKFPQLLKIIGDGQLHDMLHYNVTYNSWNMYSSPISVRF